MQIQWLKKDEIAYLVSDKVLITNEQDLLDILGEINCQSLVLHDYNLDPRCFDLSTGIMGNLLLKLTTYRVRLAIIGDFQKYPSKVLPDFIAENNRHGDYLFVDSLEKVKQHWL